MIITLLVWSERLLSLAILFQTIELLQLRPAWADAGVWRWPVLRRESARFDFFLNEKHFAALLWIRLVSCVGVWLLYPYALFIGILFFSTWLISIRWRGIFNGGSDSMTALIAFSLWIAQSFSHHSPVIKACFAYIAIQITASYFIAGIVKLKNIEWRSGVALPVFFNTPRYDSPPEWVRKLFEVPTRAKTLSWAVIIFECSFPLSWVSPSFFSAYLCMALGFHLLNFWVFGLNRFFFAWLAGYPALYFWSHRG